MAFNASKNLLCFPDAYAEEHKSSGPPQPSLLCLPTELRLRIFYYAFEDPNEYHRPCHRPWEPLRPPYFNVEYHKNVLRASRHFRTLYWGTESMSSLLRINRQLHREAEEVLYTQFLVRWVAPLQHFVGFTKMISSSARQTLRHIEIQICLSGPSFDKGEERPEIEETKKILEGVVANLTGLRSVKANFAISKAGSGRDRPTSLQAKYADTIMELLYVFRNIDRVILPHPPLTQLTPDVSWEIFDDCRKRLEARAW
ncbi:hypothetical protein K432DRAFT_382422 [Lepidopterella palustris CBS 459.81]|uniref:F-box domain-containing protein n=1 Tax=Lepidopterella palustris CBS 459.81 TaxID=1314670 RepID=A0A8E2EA49_9PEZI|nr:hypothetical protein K432DRAFT_382422 [Lepidopterella palustris CBS 459.81]